jgi:hypothetical protein
LGNSFELARQFIDIAKVNGTWLPGTAHPAPATLLTQQPAAEPSGQMDLEGDDRCVGLSSDKMMVSAANG